jgi:predicted DNA binding CopG/RHH family protein
MKAVTVRLPEELIKEIKIICINKEMEFQVAVRQSLELWKKGK